MDYAKESLKMHYELKGKIEVVSRAKVDSKDALSLAYTPGVLSLVWRFRRMWRSPMYTRTAGTPVW